MSKIIARKLFKTIRSDEEFLSLVGSFGTSQNGSVEGCSLFKVEISTAIFGFAMLLAAIYAYMPSPVISNIFAFILLIVLGSMWKSFRWAIADDVVLFRWLNFEKNLAFSDMSSVTINVGPSRFRLKLQTAEQKIVNVYSIELGDLATLYNAVDRKMIRAGWRRGAE